jgi:hypothetical protein
MNNNTFPNAKYGPFGYNDNNTAANQHIPSNMFPSNGGMSGNPFGRFNNLSTNTQNLMQNLPHMSNFNKAYHPNTPLIEQHDYSNHNELLHNNINSTVLDEHIVEYAINIDSVDRDINVYPDPFKFTVKFNPPSRNIIQTEKPIDYKNKSKGTRIEETVFEGPPGPYICKEFRNVKYIKLTGIILPQCKKNFRKEEDCKCEDLLINDRFIILRIKELEDDTGVRTYNTGDSSVRFDSSGKSFSYPKPFCIVYCDKLIGKKYYSGSVKNGERVYNNSQLGNIKQLTFEFFDSFGVPIKTNGITSGKDLNNCDCDKDEEEQHSKNNQKPQVHLSFVIGVAEAQVNTNIKFEK